MHRKPRFLFLIILVTFLGLGRAAFAQKSYKVITLPVSINSINEEFSGMALSGNRLYLLPQYGDHKDTKLNGPFSIYSISTDSIARNIAGKDMALTHYKTIRVKNLDRLPDSVKTHYQGFEAITFIKDQVFLSMETDDKYDYCFLLKGTLDVPNNEITIDPVHFIALERYPYIANAGFEGLTYLAKEHKLLALYEFNGMINGGIGYLIDTTFKYMPKKTAIPFLPFRITDIKATRKGKLYAINYYWNGDYESYLNNNLLRHPELRLKALLPDMRDSMDKNPDYLKTIPGYARIVTMDTYKARQWKQVATFDANRNNWEGLVLFGKGALTITDANRNSKQLTTLSYFEF